MNRCVVSRVLSTTLVLLCLGSSANEVLYMGKPVSEWNTALRSPDVRTRKATIASLMTVAPGADAVIPALGDALDDEDAEVRHAAVKALSVLGRSFFEALPCLIEALHSTDREVRLAALEGLSEIRPTGPTCGSPTPSVQPPPETASAVARLLKDEDARIRAAAAGTLRTLCSHDHYFLTLERLMSPALSEAFKDPERTVRVEVLKALACFRSDTQDSLLLGALRDEDEEVRHHAAVLAGDLRAIPGATIPALAEALKNRDDKVRERAVVALRGHLYLIKDEGRFPVTFQSDSDAAFSALATALKDDNAYVRRQAVLATMDLGPRAAPVVPALAEALHDKDPEIRRLVATSLGAIGTVSAVPALIGSIIEDLRARSSAGIALDKISPSAARAALVDALGGALKQVQTLDSVRGTAEALVALGPEGAREAVALLAEALQAKDPLIRNMAAMAMGKVGSAAIEVVPVLISALVDKDWTVRLAIVDALGDIGPGAAEAAPALQRILRDENQVLCDRAGSTLWRIAPREKSAIPALVRALDERDVGARSRAAGALIRFGPAAAPAVPALINALRSDDGNLRFHAALALGAIGKDALPAAPALADMLRTGAGSRSVAAGALGGIGRQAHVAIPALVEVVRYPDSEVRRWALSALRTIGPDSRPAASIVLEVLRDPDREVRVGAAL